MQKEINIRVVPEVAYQAKELKQHVARELGLDVRSISAVQVRRRSIDARQRTVYVNLSLMVYVGEEPCAAFEPVAYREVHDAASVIVVGAGPGGLFAALRLIELGKRPIVLERGRDVHSRRKDIARISREHVVDAESNYSFGEGGAGAYSDGKLYTRSKKRGNVEKILRVFCQHGASTDILCDAHPHIGTDRLPRIIEAMREQIRRSGGEVHFEKRVDALLFGKHGVEGVRTAGGEEFRGPVILATGHSARDVYRYLHAAGVALEMKGIAVGVRLEHASHRIDQIQYHNRNGRGRFLPAAEYAYTAQCSGRGVYSFCMCPGGSVVAATSEQGGIVTNGMSDFSRSADNSNSAILVSITPDDFASDDILAGLELQRSIEERAFSVAGGDYKAPSIRMEDFVSGKEPQDFGEVLPSYPCGTVLMRPEEYLPEYITDSIKAAIGDFDDWMGGFYHPDAVFTGPETRSTSPIRVLRGDNFEALGLKGLYPAGEGAGYAGGIVSSAVDGIKCAEALILSQNI